MVTRTTSTRDRKLHASTKSEVGRASQKRRILGIDSDVQAKILSQASSAYNLASEALHRLEAHARKTSSRSLRRETRALRQAVDSLRSFRRSPFAHSLSSENTMEEPRPSVHKKQRG